MSGHALQLSILMTETNYYYTTANNDDDIQVFEENQASRMALLNESLLEAATKRKSERKRSCNQSNQSG